MTNPTMEQNIRMTLAVQMKLPVNNLEELNKVYDWIIGPKSSIVPVSNFEVVK
jgi:hypothetical protein